MRLLVAVVLLATILSAASVRAEGAAACSFSGSLPTPPKAAIVGEDCRWHFFDGTSVPIFDGGAVDYSTNLEEGDTVESVLQAEAEHDALPLYIILPAAFLLPLAVLLIGALIKPRGGGH